MGEPDSKEDTKQNKKFPINYLNLSDGMTIFCCGWDRSDYFSTGIVEHGGIVIHIKNIYSDNGLPFPRSSTSLSLYVQGVEKQWHFLGRLGGRSLKKHHFCYHHCIQQTIKRYNVQTIDFKRVNNAGDKQHVIFKTELFAKNGYFGSIQKTGVAIIQKSNCFMIFSCYLYMLPRNWIFTEKNCYKE